MKKLDTTKPAIHTFDAYTATFVREFNFRYGAKFLWACTRNDGSELIYWVDEFGCSGGTQVIKNVPEPITFWVPVWKSKCGQYLGVPIKSDEPPRHNPVDESFKYLAADFIGWQGPFTLELD